MVDDTVYVRIVETLIELGERADDPADKTLREINNVLLVRREGGPRPPAGERRFPRRTAV